MELLEQERLVTIEVEKIHGHYSNMEGLASELHEARALLPILLSIVTRCCFILVTDSKSSY